MRAVDLQANELLELGANGDLHRFAGQRALLLDAAALGLLRKYLVTNFGGAAARVVLTQSGFAHGWRMAGSRTDEAPASNAQALLASPRMAELAGMFRLQVAGQSPLSEDGAVLLDSYEAEQHLLHLGRADAPVCWTITGLISGYLSRVTGADVLVVEDRCVGQGDATCHVVARTRQQWRAEGVSELHVFDPGGLRATLQTSLRVVLDELKLAEHTLQARRRALTQVLGEDEDLTGTVARSVAMRRLVELAHRVAKVDSPLLLLGEPGAGKRRIARLVHDASARAARPFVVVDCGAHSAVLLESELFGHARGAFPGASQDRVGAFESTLGGTLVLIHVGEASRVLQARLGIALQRREIQRVGELTVRAVDVRVVEVSELELGDVAGPGTLLHGLDASRDVVALRVPPLRDRREDILPLARALLGRAAVNRRRRIAGVALAAAEQLLRYPWPDNVRELEHAMEFAVSQTRGAVVELEDLPPEVREAAPRPRPSAGAVRPLEAIEQDYILAALELNHGNQTHTAQQLQIGVATLYRKLKRYGLLGDPRAKGRGVRRPRSAPGRRS